MRTLVLAMGVTSWTCCAVLLAACGGDDTNGGATGDGGADGALDATSDTAASDTGPTETGAETGGGEAGPPDGGAGAAFCVATYGALRAGFASCCSAADKTTPSYKSIDGFLQIAIQLCETQLSASIAKGRVIFDPSAAQSCEGVLQTFIGNGVCWSTIDTNQSGKGTFSSSPCTGVITGLQAAGAACAEDYECKDGLACVGWSSSSDGTCIAPGGPAQACGAEADAGSTITINYGFGVHPGCASGAYCVGSTCAAQKAAGAMCFQDEECLSGTCRVGQCGTGAPSAQNGPCRDKHDCQDGLYCQPGDGGASAGSCQPRETASGACTSGGDQCKGVCSVPDGGTTGACSAICGSG